MEEKDRDSTRGTRKNDSKELARGNTHCAKSRAIFKMTEYRTVLNMRTPLTNGTRPGRGAQHKSLILGDGLGLAGIERNSGSKASVLKFASIGHRGKGRKGARKTTVFALSPRTV